MGSPTGRFLCQVSGSLFLPELVASGREARPWAWADEDTGCGRTYKNIKKQ